MKSFLKFSVMILMLLATSVAFTTPPPGDCDTPIAYELSTDHSGLEQDFNWSDLLPIVMAVPVFNVVKGSKIVLNGKSYKECQDHLFNLSTKDRKLHSIKRKQEDIPPDEIAKKVDGKDTGDKQPSKTKSKTKTKAPATKKPATKKPAVKKVPVPVDVKEEGGDGKKIVGSETPTETA